MYCLANESMYKLNIASIHREIPELRAHALETKKIGAIGTEPCRFYAFDRYLVFVNDARVKITTLANQCIVDITADSSSNQTQPISTLPSTFRYHSGSAPQMAVLRSSALSSSSSAGVQNIRKRATPYRRPLQPPRHIA